MIAEDLINYMIPPLKPNDDIGKAQLWMDELRLAQLPVAIDGHFQGIITEEMLFDSDLSFGLVGDYPLEGKECRVNATAHFYDILKKAQSEGFRLVAVEDDLGKFLGVVSTGDLVETFAKSSSVSSPGAILSLKLNAVDYSLSEISRIIESNDAKIITSYLSEFPEDPSQLLLTIKLNVEEANRIIASLDNSGFKTENTFNAVDSGHDERERLDIFMKYLKI